jgi:hypothetical protein
MREKKSIKTDIHNQEYLKIPKLNAGKFMCKKLRKVAGSSE